MATYFFSSITSAQAQVFNASTDTIIFNTAEKGSDFRVSINSLLGTYDVTTTTGVSLAFGPGVLGATFTLADGSLVRIGTSGQDALSGSVGADGLFGGEGADALTGGAGDDVLNGGAGADTMSGGPGADTFIFDRNHTPVATPDVIQDFDSSDHLEFSALAGRSALYLESTQATLADATAYANQQIGSGAADYVVVQVGSDVLLFVDSGANDGVAEDMVRLNNVSLSQISAANVRGSTDSTPPPPPPPPPPNGGLTEPTLSDPTVGGGGGAQVNVAGNMDNAHIGHLLGAEITAALPGGLVLTGPNGIMAHITGTGFTYDANDQLTGGLDLFSVEFSDATPSGPFRIEAVYPFVAVPPFASWVQADATQLAFSTMLAAHDFFLGSPGADLIRGYGGNDIIHGAGGGDTIWGGLGNDDISASAQAPPGAPPAATYLRGEEGDDYILGGAGFDDANGNQGNDTVSTGAGDDYCVGGKDNDLLFGDAGDDIVWGNLGNDTLEGGEGNDQVRGGQGNDVLWGDAGNDFVSGDRGDDTISGGAGADTFHGSQDAGVDRILDFHLAEGDRVMLDPGTTFTVSQVGGDTVIDMGAGNQMILVGVQMSTLPPGTIFVA